MTFNKQATERGGPTGAGEAGNGLSPYDFSNIVTTHAQIKTVFRQNEMREQNFDESKEKGKDQIFKVMFRNKQKEH